MDVYKTPKSNLDSNNGRKFSPVKAIFFGFLITILGNGIVNGIVAMLILGTKGYTKEFFALVPTLANSTPFQIITLVTTYVISFLAGRIVGKYTPGKESIFGIITSILIFSFYISLYGSSFDLSKSNPWHDILIILSAIAIFFGARSNSTTLLQK